MELAELLRSDTEHEEFNPCSEMESLGNLLCYIVYAIVICANVNMLP